MAKISNPNSPVALALERIKKAAEDSKEAAKDTKKEILLESIEDVAAKLIADYPQFAGFKQRNLSKQISDLNNGNNRWWLNEKNKSRELLDSLCQLLGMEEYLPHFLKDRSDRFNFPGFHALKPLDLKLEDGWDIGEAKIDICNENSHFVETLDCWLSTTNSQTPYEKNIELLYVPDATEFDMLSHKVSVGRHKYLKINRLSEVIDGENLESLRRHEPLILVININESNTSAMQAIRANHKAPLLIISSTPFTHLNDKSNALKSNATDSHTKHIAQSPDMPTIRNWSWRLNQNWRESLVAWVESRLKIDKKSFDESPFSYAVMKEIFDVFDPREQWFTTVRDVLVLCSESYNGSGEISVAEGMEVKSDEKKAEEKKAEEEKEKDMEFVMKFSRKIPSENFKKSYEVLLKQRWQHCCIAFQGELTQGDWKDLIRAGKDDLLFSWTTFESLKKNGVITTVTQGYDLSDSLSMPLILRTYLVKTLNGVLKEDSVETLDLVGFDNQRRPYFDAALDSVNPDTLLKLVKQLNTMHKSKPRIGFNEALFLAVGRRLIRADDFFIKNENNAELLTLARNVMTEQQKYRTVAPYSPMSRTMEQLEWLSICWAWSLVLPSNFDKELFSEWLFLGGISTGKKESLEVEVPSWLKHRPGYDDQFRFRNGLTYTMQNFIAIATLLAPKLKEMPVFLPEVNFGIRLGLIQRSCEEGWEVVPSKWDGILRQEFFEDFLVKYADQKMSYEKPKIAKLWWPSLVRHLRTQNNNSSPKWGYTDYFASNSLSQSYSKLMAWVMVNLGEESNLLNDLDDEDRHFLVNCPNSLPTFVKKQLLKWLYDNDMVNPPQILLENDSTLLRFGNEMAQDLVMFLDTWVRRNEAAKLLWLWQPVETRDMLKAGKLSDEALKVLILESPSIAMDHVIELLVQLKRLLTPSEVRKWALEKLPDSRHNAGKLIELIHQANEEIKQADEKNVRLTTLH
ncbi:hypothetical protein [Undibacterium sp. Di24W]|uniref:hypothetical protein n=1 Tax=Undibacterium sp. Di24W TaxID=3413033 RepID=UPI003BF45D73